MIHRDWHRRGAGRYLLDARLDALRAIGVRRVHVQASQHSAGFFERAGFVAHEREPDGFAPGIERIELWRILT